MHLYLAAKLEEHASKHWEKFYQMHKSSFFKDRYWLRRELPELQDGSPIVLEVNLGLTRSLKPPLQVSSFYKLPIRSQSFCGKYMPYGLGTQRKSEDENLFVCRWGAGWAIQPSLFSSSIIGHLSTPATSLRLQSAACKCMSNTAVAGCMQLWQILQPMTWVLLLEAPLLIYVP